MGFGHGVVAFYFIFCLSSFVLTAEERDLNTFDCIQRLHVFHRKRVLRVAGRNLSLQYENALLKMKRTTQRAPLSAAISSQVAHLPPPT